VSGKTIRRGATATEYGLITALIALVLVGALSSIGLNEMTSLGTVSWAIGSSEWGDLDARYNDYLYDFDFFNGEDDLMSASELNDYNMVYSPPQYLDYMNAIVMETYDADFSGDLDLAEWDDFAVLMSDPTTGGPWSLGHPQ
jgi:Flp pilus assembly pilin Flp